MCGVGDDDAVLFMGARVQLRGGGASRSTLCVEDSGEGRGQGVLDQVADTGEADAECR